MQLWPSKPPTQNPPPPSVAPGGAPPVRTPAMYPLVLEPGAPQAALLVGRPVIVGAVGLAGPDVRTLIVWSRSISGVRSMVQRWLVGMRHQRWAVVPLSYYVHCRVVA
ncbi:hypothetical protein ACWDG1_47500 [Streptomyces sp. NPDC001177]